MTSYNGSSSGCKLFVAANQKEKEHTKKQRTRMKANGNRNYIIKYQKSVTKLCVDKSNNNKAPNNSI